MLDGGYEDDLDGVPPGSQIIRRINGRFCVWNELDEQGMPRINRQAVQFYRLEEAQQLGCPGPGASFHLEHMVVSMEALRRSHPGYGFARIGVDDVRADGVLGAQRWPTDENPEHVVVFRNDGGARLQASQAKRLAEYLTRNWIGLPTRPDVVG